MNNQFATQFLREDTEEVSADELVADLKPTIEKGLAAGMSKEEILAIIDQVLSLDEMTGSGAVGGGSTTGGGVTNGAAFTPGAGEQYASTKAFKKKKYQEALGNSNCIPVEDIVRVMKDYRAGEISNLFLAIMDLGSKYGLKLNEGESHKFKVGDKVKYRGQDCEVVKLLDWGYQIKGPHFTSNVIKADVERNVSEDAPMLAHGTANISTYTKDGFTKAPDAEEAGKHMKSIDVKMLWKEGDGKKNLSPEAIKIIQDFISRNIPSHLHGDFKQEIAKDLTSDIFNAESTINDLKRFLEDKAAFFGERYTEGLNESRAYSRFKKETATRSETERMHEAAKMINSRLEEISKILEFTRQMREELSEGEETLEYKHNTKKVFEKINKKVIEVYSKTKKLG